RVEFLFVYISEAPHDSTPLPEARTPLPAGGNDAASRLARVRWYEGEAGGGLTWLIDGGREAGAAYDYRAQRPGMQSSEGRGAEAAGRGWGWGGEMGVVEGNRGRAADHYPPPPRRHRELSGRRAATAAPTE